MADRHVCLNIEQSLSAYQIPRPNKIVRRRRRELYGVPLILNLLTKSFWIYLRNSVEFSNRSSKRTAVIGQLWVGFSIA